MTTFLHDRKMERNSEKEAITLLLRAVDLDGKRRKTDALAMYKEGIGALMQVINQLKKEKSSDDKKLNAYNTKVREYMDRAEQLKLEIDERNRILQVHKKITVEEGSIGNSYQSLFGKFLDEDVSEVQVEDPYIRAHHQIQNFLRFCELLVKKCKNLTSISLLTSISPNQRDEQSSKLDELKSDLKNNHKITLSVKYSESLHDREIRILPSGWVIKIGRGLDIYKATKGKFVIGQFDQDLRPCHETTVDIFNKSTISTER